MKNPESLSQIAQAELPVLVTRQLDGFDPVQLQTFTKLYHQQRRSLAGMETLAILFPIQMLLLKQVGLWFAFFFTGGGFGIWWIIEWFLTPGRVRKYNATVAMEIAVQVTQMGRA